MSPEPTALPAAVLPPPPTSAGAAGAALPAPQVRAPLNQLEDGPKIAGEPPARLSMLGLLRNREFCALVVTQFLSIAGDQLARVALTVLVFNRTNSALEAAIAYALTFIPAAIGGPLLSGLADRLPRRSVMIVTDLARAPLIACIAIPRIPLIVAMGLVAIVGLLEAPFSAGRGALLPDLLSGESYPIGYALSQMAHQTAQVGGFGIAGLLLIASNPSTLLLIDASTFVFSALVVARFVKGRPAAVAEPRKRGDSWLGRARADARTSVHIVLRNPQIRHLALLTWSVSTFAIGFEALGAPLARASGSPSWAVGVLLAAQPAGTVLGALFVGRIPAARRTCVMRVLALLTMLPLAACALRPGLGLLVALGVLSGLGWSFDVLASTTFISRVPAAVRGRALGLVITGLLVGQGTGVVLAGALASGVDARVAVGLMGLIGAATGLAAILDGLRSSRAERGHASTHPGESGHAKAPDNSSSRVI